VINLNLVLRGSEGYMNEDSRKKYFKSIIDKLHETDYYQCFNKSDLNVECIMALLVEQNATLALMCNLLAQVIYADRKGEPIIIHCPKCHSDVTPDGLNYCPKCKEDLAKYVKLIQPE